MTSRGPRPPVSNAVAGLGLLADKEPELLRYILAELVYQCTPRYTLHPRDAVNVAPRVARMWSAYARFDRADHTQKVVEAAWAVWAVLVSAGLEPLCTCRERMLLAAVAEVQRFRDDLRVLRALANGLRHEAELREEGPTGAPYLRGFQYRDLIRELQG